MSGAAWTPIQVTPGTADAEIESKYYAGIQITTNGTASTTNVRLDAVGGTIQFQYLIEAVTGGTTRLFPMPGMVILNGNIYVDVDANVDHYSVLHG